jgi:hypothetical protein
MKKLTPSGYRRNIEPAFARASADDARQSITPEREAGNFEYRTTK